MRPSPLTRRWPLPTFLEHGNNITRSKPITLLATVAIPVTALTVAEPAV